VPTRDIAADEGISYELTCKLLQKLSKARLVKSTMGPNGGFELNRNPEKITLAQVIEQVQGPVKLNRCLLPGFKCPKKKNCTVREKLAELQEHIDNYFEEITLADLVNGKNKK